MEMELGGKRVLVTGGSRGIGHATALAFAREGAQVAICARDQGGIQRAAEAIQAQTGAKVLAIQADISDPQSVVNLIGRTVAGLGGLDILINNAGRATPGLLERTADEDWLGDYWISIGGMARVSRAALPHLRQAGGGAVVNVTAIVGREPNANIIIGASHRAGCMAFTKALANELGPDGVRVNSVSIGVVWNQSREQALQRSGLPREEFLAPTLKTIPLGRVGEPAEVADAILYLASARAGYITGSNLDLGGGIGRSAF